MAKNKLWDKGQDLNERVERFTVGKDRDLDLLLAEYDVKGTMAHIRMLESVGLLEAVELDKLLAELQRILDEVIIPGNFVIEEGIEDVHSQIEVMLTRTLGDIGKKVHSGRSRNDQVLVDLRLFFRDALLSVAKEMKMLFETLQAQSEKYKDLLMPGYTHMQAAMPSSFGLWFGAYAESLADDLVILESTYRVVNKNPLGSAAGYGSSFPLNRQITTDLLGFEQMVHNVVYAQMGRGKTEQLVAQAIAVLAGTLNKMAMDVCTYNSQNFGFLELPEEYTTGSSIMPHKKNPDVFELIRARTNRLRALPNEVAMVTANLSSGYHRDFQLLKEQLFPAIQEIIDCLSISAEAIAQVGVREDILEDDRYKLIFSVEVVNKLVLDGLPFRDAYKEVGKQIEEGTFKVPDTLEHTHEGSIGNLMNEQIGQMFMDTYERLRAQG
ncbi:argininosuccinate lyase [Balneola sp. MJW-20]|uniref:argininosuccinate lyase n=1 Tax=Gracilimonas aurantiaca TaxID=3234185 RepID=UPI003466318E